MVIQEFAKRECAEKSILALDVGFKSLGYAILTLGTLSDIGVVITEKSKKKSTRVADDYAWRAGILASGLKGLIEANSICGIVGELPSGGAQSAKAMVMMNMATAIVSSVATVLDMPCEWCTPNEVKLASTGYRSATKDMVMDAIVEKFGGKVDVNRVAALRTKKGFRENRIYHLAGKRFPGTMFEHIADALGAYLALANGNVIRMFGKAA